MIQTIDGITVYVVEFDTMPELPITGLTYEESVYQMLTTGPGINLANLAGGRITYAQALTNAIETGAITEPGKYGIHLVPGTQDYKIFTIIEK